MKIISGSLRGRKLKSPKGLATRPVLARVREALFSVIGDVSGMRVLDLYAGTGAVGIEALSRGAESVILVENRHNQCRLIRENLDALGKEAVVIKADVFTALKRLGQKGGTFDFIFADPPYEQGLSRRTIEAVFSSVVLAENGVLAVTVRHTEDFPEDGPGFKQCFNRRYGDTRLVIYRLNRAGM